MKIASEENREWTHRNADFSRTEFIKLAKGPRSAVLRGERDVNARVLYAKERRDRKSDATGIVRGDSASWHGLRYDLSSWRPWR